MSIEMITSIAVLQHSSLTWWSWSYLKIYMKRSNLILNQVTENETSSLLGERKTMDLMEKRLEVLFVVQPSEIKMCFIFTLF